MKIPYMAKRILKKQGTIGILILLCLSVIFTIIDKESIFNTLSKEIRGKVIKIYDGDTITLLHDNKRLKIRLYGIDLSYLYDFISISRHTFGLNASVGYEFGSFSSSFVTPDEMGSGTTEIKLKSYNTSSFTISYGVHYFLNSSHQFWLTYKYRNYSSSNGSILQDDVIVNYGNKPTNSFNFAYAYKF